MLVLGVLTEALRKIQKLKLKRTKSLGNTLSK